MGRQRCEALPFFVSVNHVCDSTPIIPLIYFQNRPIIPLTFFKNKPIIPLTFFKKQLNALIIS